MHRIIVLGDVQTFYSDVIKQLQEKNISASLFPLSHLCFRVATMDAYETTHTSLKDISRSYSRHYFHQRPFSIFVLKKPLLFSKLHIVELVELPSPKEDHPYPTGLEHIGFVLGNKLPAFQKQYSDVLSDKKDRITFSNGHTAKFYTQSLWETVEEEGQVFHPL